MSDFWIQVFSGVVATFILGCVAGGTAWLRATYKMLSTVNDTLTQIRNELSGLRELTKAHESRLDRHETELAFVKGAIR